MLRVRNIQTIFWRESVSDLLTARSIYEPVNWDGVDCLNIKQVFTEELLKMKMPVINENTQ
jgi:hypothetical protein